MPIHLRDCGWNSVVALLILTGSSCASPDDITIQGYPSAIIEVSRDGASEYEAVDLTEAPLTFEPELTRPSDVTVFFMSRRLVDVGLTPGQLPLTDADTRCARRVWPVAAVDGAGQDVPLAEALQVPLSFVSTECACDRMVMTRHALQIPDEDWSTAFLFTDSVSSIGAIGVRPSRPGTISMLTLDLENPTFDEAVFTSTSSPVRGARLLPNDVAFETTSRQLFRVDAEGNAQQLCRFFDRPIYQLSREARDPAARAELLALGEDSRRPGEPWVMRVRASGCSEITHVPIDGETMALVDGHGVVISSTEVVHTLEPNRRHWIPADVRGRFTQGSDGALYALSDEALYRLDPRSGFSKVRDVANIFALGVVVRSNVALIVGSGRAQQVPLDPDSSCGPAIPTEIPLTQFQASIFEDVVLVHAFPTTMRFEFAREENE